LTATQHSRIEDIKNRKFDYVISRAVAPLKDLWRGSKPLLADAKKQNAKSEDLDVTPKGVNQAPALICLKGGDLAKEIQESQTRPQVLPIKEIFDEPFFEEKFLVYVKK